MLKNGVPQERVWFDEPQIELKAVMAIKIHKTKLPGGPGYVAHQTNKM